MSFTHQSGLRYFQFNSLRINHAVFTRHGGISPAPWNSLNVGGTVGDEVERVRHNRYLSFQAMRCKTESMFDAWQVHGADVAFADAPRPTADPVQQADILLTDKPEVTLFMRFADCVPIFVHDPVQHVIGLSHAGWMGTLKDVAGQTVRAMRERYKTNPDDVIACIGPSIGVDHYEVGDEVVEKARAVFGEHADQVLEPHGERLYFDLWKANQLLLEQAGVTQIETAGICTACHLEDWFSHRAEKGKTGRFGALISLAGM